MLDDIRMEDLEEIGVGAMIQRRKLLRIVKQAQEEGVDVNFDRSNLLNFAKRIRDIQRERLKDVKGIDLSFLDRPLLEDDEQENNNNYDYDDGSQGGGMFRVFLLAILVSIVAIGYQNGHYDNLSDVLSNTFESISSSLNDYTHGDVATPKKKTTTYDSSRPSSSSSSSAPSTTTTTSKTASKKEKKKKSKKRKTSSPASSSKKASSSRRTAHKCFSMSASASKWKHKYKYPTDVENHYEELLDATQPFRIQPFHDYAGYNGPWIENHWIFTFMGKPLSDFGPYIPLFIQWTDILLWGKPSYEEIENVLLKVLRPDVMYITVVQGAEGLKSVGELFPNILVLSSGGHGHVPLPLLKMEYRHEPTPSKKNAVVTFVGKMLSNRRDVVNALKNKMGENEFRKYRGNDWKNVLRESHFALTPRGFGRSSFNVYVYCVMLCDT